MPSLLTASSSSPSSSHKSGRGFADGQRAKHRLLRQECRRLEGPADTHADHDRGTRVRASPVHGLDHDRADAGDAIGRHEHPQRAHVLRAKALRRDRHTHSVAGHEIDVNHAGCVAAACDLQTPRRVAGHRPAQISGARALTNRLVHRLVQRATHEVHVLPDLEHDDRDAAVLADRQPLLRGNLVVPNELFDRAAPERRLLAQRRRRAARPSTSAGIW